MFDKQSLEPSALTETGDTRRGAGAGTGARGEATTRFSNGSTYHHYHQPHR